jgi:hypothetical protein
MGILSRIWDFLSAVFLNWKALLAGVFFVIVSLLQLLPRETRQKIDDVIPPELRRKFLVWAAVAFFFLSSFLAYDDVNMNLIEAKQSALVSPYHWQWLSQDEAVALRAELRDMTPQPIYILCAEADCDDLAKSFRDVFSALHWMVECCQFGYHGFDSGIQLSGANAQLTDIAGKIEVATRGRLKIDVSKTYTMDPAKFPVQIMIGPKP